MCFEVHSIVFPPSFPPPQDSSVLCARRRQTTIQVKGAIHGGYLCCHLILSGKVEKASQRR